MTTFSVDRKPIPEKIEVVETVNHPPHYSSIPAKCDECGNPIECITVVRHQNFNLGNAMKYIWRCGHKGDAVEDLEKAIFYLKDEIEKLKSQMAYKGE